MRLQPFVFMMQKSRVDTYDLWGGEDVNDLTGTLTRVTVNSAFAAQDPDNQNGRIGVGRWVFSAN